MEKNPFDQLFYELTNLVVTYSSRNKAQEPQDFHFVTVPEPNFDHPFVMRLNLYYYNWLGNDYEYMITEYHEAALTEVIYLTPEQIVSQIQRLRIVEVKYSQFWEWYNDISKTYKQSDFDYIDLILALHDFFNIPKVEANGPYAKDFMQDLYEIVTIKHKHLIKFIAEGNKIILNNDGLNTTTEKISTVEIDNILNDMFSLVSFELETLRDNLFGKLTYIPLNYIGSKHTLWNNLGKLRSAGIDRVTIASVFSKYCKWQRTIASEPVSLGYDEIYKKIGKKGAN